MADPLVHLAAPSALTGCCGRNVFTLGAGVRVTLDAGSVTCPGATPPLPPTGPGELTRAAAGYLEAADGIRAALEWAYTGGPAMADSYEGGARREEILADLEKTKADPLAYHFGHHPEAGYGQPTNWPSGAEWAPAPDQLGNLVKARDLIEAEIAGLRARQRALDRLAKSEGSS